MFLFKSEIMDMKEEMMNDAIDDVIGDEEDDEERLVFFFSFEKQKVFCKLSWAPLSKQSSLFFKKNQFSDKTNIHIIKNFAQGLAVKMELYWLSEIAYSLLPMFTDPMYLKGLSHRM